MDKELFKDKNPLLRRQMLEDNCAAVERITYTSPFSEEEMGERKTELANIDLDMAALEEEKKAFMQAYKDKLKPKKERKKTLLTDIKRGYETMSMNRVYRFFMLAVFYLQRYILFYHILIFSKIRNLTFQQKPALS